MTTVEFGGGPTIEARRQFANLKDGSQLPKYTGYIHQLKYRHGRTYGEETHRLARQFPDMKRLNIDATAPVIVDHSDPYETREFPDGMLPGYTGYIPQRKFQIGNRYRVETDACLEGSKAAYERAKAKTKALNNTIAAYPKTDSLNSATVVKHFLDYHRSYNPNEASQRTDRRPFVEPPLPGYKGFIPRIQPIDIGLGDRYHEATRKGLSRFAVETSTSTTNFPTNVDFDAVPNNDKNADDNDTNKLRSQSMTFIPRRSVSTLDTHRLYPNSGMIPKYTGYLPQRKYRIGQTYGDTSRNLPVCSHSLGNFGEFLRSKSTMDYRSSGAN